MNLFIMADAEGISGIYAREQVTASPYYDECRKRMTQDINACVEACKQAGVEKIYVRDCHGSGCSVLWEELSPLADYYIMGITNQNRFPGLDDCDGVILLGYHAMAGTPEAILEHTFSSATAQNYWVNGIKAGETAIDAGIAGDRGKPVIMVSGDDKLCLEAKALMPWVVTAEVKRGITWHGGFLLPAEKAHAVIRECTREAIMRMPEMKPLVFDKPIKIRIERTERNDLPRQYSKPYMKIIDGRTYEVEGATMEEALSRTS